MLKHRYFIEEMLAPVGITINGNSPSDIRIKDERTFASVLRNRNLGLGEAYMEGWWECKRLDEFFCKILKANLDEKIRGGCQSVAYGLYAFLFNLQSQIRSLMVADCHYNLGNELFMSFLDPYRQYSCAYFDGTEDLDEAQIKKMELICKKINLQREDHVLDIGCGWGGLAKYMAECYGCRVTAVNIATEQIQYAKDFCKDLPVDVQNCDYRNLSGNFDKIISVGMFEHVGQKNYKMFMETVHRCLKGNGVFLLHTIGGNNSKMNCDPWINKYIFPNGMLPSVAQIGRVVEGLFVMEDWHNLGPHYEKTLMAWHGNFQKAWSDLHLKYDEKFKRMWDYYLLSCAGAFRARSIQLWQIVFTKSGVPQPSCR